MTKVLAILLVLMIACAFINGMDNWMTYIADMLRDNPKEFAKGIIGLLVWNTINTVLIAFHSHKHGKDDNHLLNH